MSDTHEVISYTFKLEDTGDAAREAGRAQARINEEAKKSAQRVQGSGPTPPPQRPGRSPGAELPYTEEERRERRHTPAPRPGSIAGGAAQLFQNIPALRQLTGVQDSNAAGVAVSALVNAIGTRSSLMYRLTRAASALSNAASFVERSHGGIGPSGVGPGGVLRRDAERPPSALTETEREDFERFKSKSGPAYDTVRKAIENQYERAKATGNFEHPDPYTRTIFKGLREEEGHDVSENGGGVSDRVAATAKKATSGAGGAGGGGRPTASAGPADDKPDESATSKIADTVGKQVAGRAMNPILEKLARGGTLGKIGDAVSGFGERTGIKSLQGVKASTVGRAFAPIAEGASMVGRVAGFGEGVGGAIGGAAGGIAAALPAIIGAIRGGTQLGGAVLNSNPTQAAHAGVTLAQGVAGTAGALGGAAIGSLIAPGIGTVVGGVIGAIIGPLLLAPLHKMFDELDSLVDRLHEFNPILAGENLKFGLEVKMFNVQLAQKLQPMLTQWIHLKEHFLQIMSDLVSSRAFGGVVKVVEWVIEKLDFLVTTVDKVIKAFDWVAYGITKAIGYVLDHIPGTGSMGRDMMDYADSIKPGPSPNLADAANNFAKNFIAALNIQGPITQGVGGAANADALTGRAIGPQIDVSKLPRRAQGGPILKNQWYLVGENGPEIVVPKGDGTVINNDDLRTYERVYRMWGQEEAEQWLADRQKNIENKANPGDSYYLKFSPYRRTLSNSTEDREREVLTKKFGKDRAMEILGQQEIAAEEQKHAHDYSASDLVRGFDGMYGSKIPDAWRRRSGLFEPGNALTGNGLANPDHRISPGVAIVDGHEWNVTHRSNPGAISLNGNIVRQSQAGTATALRTNLGDFHGGSINAGATGDQYPGAMASSAALGAWYASHGLDNPNATPSKSPIVSQAAASGASPSTTQSGDQSSAGKTGGVDQNSAVARFARGEKSSGYPTGPMSPSQAAASRTTGAMPQVNLGMSVTQNNDFKISCEKEVDIQIHEVRKRLLKDFNIVQSETRLLAAMIDGGNIADLM